MSAIKKLFFTYAIAAILLATVVTVLRGWFDVDHIPLFLGAMFGIFLPDIDHFIYVFYLKPHELTSQRVKRLAQTRSFKSIIQLLYNTKEERTTLIFHNFVFQVLFIVLSFYILTSTSDYFGKGLVLAFLLHLLIDEYFEFKQNNNINTWFHNFELNLNPNQTKYFLGLMFAVLLFLGLVV